MPEAEVICIIRSPGRRATSKVGGTAVPNSLAFFRLITEVNLLACSIGRSPSVCAAVYPASATGAKADHRLLPSMRHWCTLPKS